MTSCHAQGRLGFSIDSLFYHSLLQLLRHCAPDDPLLKDESLQRIETRMAQLRQQPGGEAAHEAAVKAVGWEMGKE